jgi:hypothetical protein
LTALSACGQPAETARYRQRAILRYRGLNGRAQRFREHRHGTDAQWPVFSPLGARPRCHAAHWNTTAGP